MTVRNFLNDPAPELFELRVRQELALLDQAPAPPPIAPAKLDGLFTKNQWDMLQEMTLPGAPPADTTNAKADDPAAAALGKSLFSDQTLSPSGTVACTTCHDPAPSLRGVASTAPYGHGGTLATLADVAINYSTAGLDPNDPRAAGTVPPWLTTFDTHAAAALVPFLSTLTAAP